MAYPDVWWASGWGGEVVHACNDASEILSIEKFPLGQLDESRDLRRKIWESKTGKSGRAPIVHQSLTVARSAVQFLVQKM